jgi:NAD(P)-dependent dehydrogenase (short-subunit alcohol dehydrogenase family)
MAESAFSLAGRVALVTGGATGIGAAVARRLAERGADVAVSYRVGSGSEAAVPGLREELVAATGRELVAVDFDVRDVDAVRRGVEHVAERLGRLDILVTSAGTNVQQPALDVDEATWDLIVDTNLKGTFFACQAAARVMRQARGEDEPWAAIVNIASQMGLVGWHRRAAYCASKAGVVNLTRVLAVEWAAERIRVNAVAPGFVETPLAAPMLADEAFRGQVKAASPMGRIGEPREVADAVLYLASDEARWVTGHTLAIDGGWTAW